MKSKAKLGAQLSLVLLCALGLKHFYSVASPDQLRWILAPTTWLVELLSGYSFTFESHAGYMSSDHSFLIAASCAGVNFMITAFVLLTMRKFWTHRDQSLNWFFIPGSLLIAYGATICANTVRIWIALESRSLAAELDWLSGSQIHRLEGIIIYFGFLLILVLITEKKPLNSSADLFRLLRFPLLIYYLTALAIPLLNGAFRQPAFWEHGLFVLLVPALLVGSALAVRPMLSLIQGDHALMSGMTESGIKDVGDCSLRAPRSKVIS